MLIEYRMADLRKAPMFIGAFYCRYRCGRWEKDIIYCKEALSKDEARDFISKKLEGAGCTRQIFDDSALEAIINYSDGTPRLICKCCNAALLIGHSCEANIIDSDIVMKAVNDGILG